MAEETIRDVDASGHWPGKVVTEISEAGPFWEVEAGRGVSHSGGSALSYPQLDL